MVFWLIIGSGFSSYKSSCTVSGSIVTYDQFIGNRFSALNSNFIDINTNTGLYYGASNLYKQAFGVAIGYTNGSPGAGFYIIADNNGGTQGRITTTVPSDRRLKSNIQNISFEENNKLYSLTPREYNLSNNYPIESMRGKKQIGLIADEAESILPEIVIMSAIEKHIVHSWSVDGNSLTEEQMILYGDGQYSFAEDGVYKDAEYQQIDYSALVPRLLSAIIDLNTRLKTLEHQLGYNS